MDFMFDLSIFYHVQIYQWPDNLQFGLLDLLKPSGNFTYRQV
jgi:hypothetical protein